MSNRTNNPKASSLHISCPFGCAVCAKDAFSRAMMREKRADASSDLIYPVFILDGKNQREKDFIDARCRAPFHRCYCFRWPEECVVLGIPVMASNFRSSIPAVKTPDGIEATNPRV